MDNFLRWKFAQAGGNILSGSSLQKPASFQPNKLPDLCSNFSFIANEPFPQVSGFLDDTGSPSFISDETRAVLNSPVCTPSKNQAKNIDEGVIALREDATNDSGLNCSLGAHCQSADASTSTTSPQIEKYITTAMTGKVDDNCIEATVSTTSLEKSDLINAELKNSTFDVSQDLKERSDAGINATVDLHNIVEKNCTFEVSQDSKEWSDAGINATVDLHNVVEKNSTFDVSQESKEQPDAGINVTVDLHSIREKNCTFESQEPRLNSTVDIDVPNTKTESGNTSAELVQSHDTKEGPDTRVNAAVDIPNIDGAQSKTNSCVDSSVTLNTTTEQPNDKLEGTLDVQPQDKLNSFNYAEVDAIRNTEEAHLKVNVTVDIVEQTASAPLQSSAEVEQSNSALVKAAETNKHNTTTDLTPPEVVALKDTTVEIKPSSIELADQVNDASNSVGVTKPASNSKETEVEISTTAFVCSVNAPDDAPEDAPELKAEVHHTNPSSPVLADAESIPPSDMENISRHSIFCLDDTLDMKTSFLITSTPIVFGKESRFEIMRDVKPRKRLSVINSIEAQSNDELVCASNHEGTDAVQATESSSQKVSATCTTSTSEPANEIKPTTKLPIKRQLPQLSSKLSYPKSSLPTKPQLSGNSSVAVKLKTLPAPLEPDASSTTLPGNRKTVQMNKGKNTAPVKSIASASILKTSVVSAVTGCNLAAVAKPSSAGIQQMKPSGLLPPIRKRLALKTPQTTQSSVETVQTQPNNKSTALPGMRKRITLLPSVGQNHLNNDGLPSAKKKRIAPALSTVESDAVHAAEGAHEPGCVNCLQHHEKLQRVIQELMSLRSECKNCGPLHEKLEMCIEELKRI